MQSRDSQESSPTPQFKRKNPFSYVQFFATPWALAHQAPLSMGFSRQEYWRGEPFPPPGDLPDPGFKPTPLMSPALANRFFTTGATWVIDGLVKRQLTKLIHVGSATVSFLGCSEVKLATMMTCVEHGWLSSLHPRGFSFASVPLSPEF